MDNLNRSMNELEQFDAMIRVATSNIDEATSQTRQFFEPSADIKRYQKHQQAHQHQQSCEGCANQQEQTLELTSLRKQAEQLSYLLQVMPAGVIVIDNTGTVKQANEQAIQLLGEPLEGELWRSIIQRAFKPRKSDGHEVSLADGRLVKLSITPLQYTTGQLIVITDLTETRQLQARVSHMQRLSALGKMVASLAHQIRTPLSAAMLYAANLRNKNITEQSSHRFVDKLTARLQELESQVNDMLLFAKSGEEQVVNPLSLSTLLNEVKTTAQTMADKNQIHIEFSGFSQNKVVLGNTTALQGALLNLIENAREVTPAGGSIQVKAQASKNGVAISVIDQGPGVSDQLKNKICEPFFTTKTNGTGLGLAVVKSVAAAHKGQLTITNLSDTGACFTLVLPKFDFPQQDMLGVG